MANDFDYGALWDGMVTAMGDVLCADPHCDMCHQAAAYLREQIEAVFVSRADASAALANMNDIRGEVMQDLAERTDMLREATARAEAAEAEVARLREALRPFASLAHEVEQVAAACGTTPDNVVKACQWNDLLAAHDALGDAQ